MAFHFAISSKTQLCTLSNKKRLSYWDFPLVIHRCIAGIRKFYVHNILIWQIFNTLPTSVDISFVVVVVFNLV